MKVKTYSIEDKIKAQERRIKEKGYPYFPPRTGQCFKCSRQIYDRISYEKASKELITGCPFCNYSFCG